MENAGSHGTSNGFWRDLWSYFGPALIVSVAYMDPGNYGTDISGGVSFGYCMLWIVWLAGIMAMQLQYLSGKLGIATGHSSRTNAHSPQETCLHPPPLVGL